MQVICTGWTRATPRHSRLRTCLHRVRCDRRWDAVRASPTSRLSDILNDHPMSSCPPSADASSRSRWSVSMSDLSLKRKKSPDHLSQPGAPSGSSAASPANPSAMTASITNGPPTPKGDVTRGTGGSEEGFERVLTREEKRKKKKLDKKKARFQFDISTFKTGRKIGIAVSFRSSAESVADQASISES